MAIELIAKIAPKNNAFQGMVDADQAIVDPSGFDYVLSPEDTDVQHALDTLNAHAHDGRYEPADAAIMSHVNTTSGNPHGTGYADVGAAPAGDGAAAVQSHEGSYAHGDIAHANRSALDDVEGVNTGDQDLSGYATTTHASAHAEGGTDVVSPASIGAQEFHGIQTAGTLSFANDTHIVTLTGSVVYWYQGDKVTVSSPTCDLDSYVTLTTNKLYYVYFEDATGTLKASENSWSLATKVPVCTVYWNGSAGAVINEQHAHNRNLGIHGWAHSTIGARIRSADFAMTAPSSGSPSTVDFAGGSLYDEDLVSTFTRNNPANMLLNCRIWYEVSAGVYTWVDSNSVYPAGGVSFVDSGAAYALRAITSGSANCWIYVSPDIDRPLYVFLETINRNGTAGYSTTAARAITPPALSAMGLTPELKLLYRVIMTSAEAFTESTDYRASASLPAGGATAPTASSVALVATGDFSSGSVQTGFDEAVCKNTYNAHTILAATTDNTPAALTVSEGTVVGRLSGGNISAITIGTGSTNVAAGNHTHTVTDRIVAVFDGGGSAISADKKVYVYVPFSCTIVDWTALADVSGSITVDVWKDTYANFPPTNDDSITGSSQEIKITTSTKGQDLDVTNWDNNPQTITAGDVLCFNVDSCTSITWCQVVLTVTRSV